MRRTLLLLLCLVLVAAPVEAARLFNGTSDSLQSASAIDLSAYDKITVAYWLYLNSNSGVQLVFECSTNNTNVVGAPNLLPFHSTFSAAYTSLGGNPAPANNVARTYTTPSAAAWHHFVVIYDRTRASHEIFAVYVDGVSTALTDQGSDFDSAGTFANQVWYFMARANASLWTAGRFAEIAIWGGIVFSQSDVNSLYNGGAGTLATNVQPGSLVNYWRVLGDASPEPATTGSIALTVNGTTKVQHPFDISASPSSRAPKDIGQRRRSTR